MCWTSYPGPMYHQLGSFRPPRLAFSFSLLLSRTPLFRGLLSVVAERSCRADHGEPPSHKEAFPQLHLPTMFFFFFLSFRSVKGEITIRSTTRTLHLSLLLYSAYVCFGFAINANVGMHMRWWTA